jgi:type IV pilus assembly protein PilF
MRLREIAGLAVLAAMVASGCSRLAFIKTSPDRRSYEQTSAPVEVHESTASRQRAALRTQVALAQTALLKGDLDAAERAARQAQRDDGRSAAPETLLAIIEERRGRPAGAGAHYLRATELAPRDGAVANNYGAWLCANDRVAESLGWFERALADPAYRTPAAALANSGACALRAGEVTKADRELRAAIRLDPENAVALGALARLQFQSGRYMEARAFSERRLAAAQADASALELASQIERKLGDTAAADRYVRRLREEFPGNVPGNPGDTTQR